MMVLASRAPGRQAWTDSVTSHLRLFHKADNRQMNTTELKPQGHSASRGIDTEKDVILVGKEPGGAHRQEQYEAEEFHSKGFFL